MKTVHFFAILLAVFTHSGLLRAQLITTVTGAITVDADFGASFKAGDTFLYSFTFDQATSDTNNLTFSANFNAGASAFSLSRGASNTGIWDPAGGTFDVAPLFNVNVGANSEQVTFQAKGSGFPAMNGTDFFDVRLSFNFSSVYDFVDTGSGQTFAEMTGQSPLNFTMASALSAEIRDTNFQSPSLSMSVDAIPEPAAASILFGCASLGLVLARRKRSGR